MIPLAWKTWLRELLLSRSQLHRKLNQLVGLSASRFMRSIRLEKSRVYLQNPSRTIAEIAYACGFRDPDYFTRVFGEDMIARLQNSVPGREKGVCNISPALCNIAPVEARCLRIALVAVITNTVNFLIDAPR